MGTPVTRRPPARLLWLIPAAMILGAGFFWPVLRILPEALTSPAGLEAVLTQPAYLNVVWATLRISLISAATTLLIAYPAAWFIATTRGTKQITLIVLILLPFLTSILVRAFSWIAILGTNGLINSVLLGTGIIDEPLQILFTETAVVIGIVHVSLPLMTFPLVASMRSMNPELLRVGESLGASRISTFAKILIPLTRGGIRSGLIIVTLFSLASFIAPAVLGSTNETMLSQLVQAHVESGSNRPQAAALSVLLAVSAVICVSLIAVALRPWNAGRRNRRSNTVGPSTAAVARSTLSPMPARNAGHAFLRAGIIAGRLASSLYLTLLGAFSVAPLLILIPVSFTSSSVLVFPTPGFSTRWFEAVFADPEWLAAALTSVRIAAIAAAGATALAISVVLAIGRSPRLARFIEPVTLLPLMIPSIVFALGAYVTFASLGLVDNELGIALVQGILALPVAYLVVSASYAQLGIGLERAARSLGATPAAVLMRITVPLLAPALAVSFMMSLLLSFDESVASIFISGIRVETLPRKIWNSIRFDTSPEIAAVAVLVLAFAILIMLAMALILKALDKTRSLSKTVTGTN